MAPVALGDINEGDRAIIIPPALSGTETEIGVAPDLELSLGLGQRQAPDLVFTGLHLAGPAHERQAQRDDHLRIEDETSRAKPSSSSSSSVRARLRISHYYDRPWTRRRHRIAAELISTSTATATATACEGDRSSCRYSHCPIRWRCVCDDDEDDACTAMPLEVLERVLVRLPIIPLFRFRMVCRTFRALPFDPAFQAMRSSMAPQEHPWLLMLNKPFDNLGLGFLPREDKWISLPSSFEPEPEPGGQGRSCQGSRFYFCAAAGGLLCYCKLAGENETQVQSMWVGNPLTGNWKCLPPTTHCLQSNFPATGLAEMVTLDPADTRAHYKVVVRTWLCENRPVLEEYDSQTDEWTVTSTQRDLTRSQLQQVVHCNGTLYFLGQESHAKLFAFNLESKELSRVPLPQAYGCSASIHLVDCCGNLVLVASYGWLQFNRHARTMDVRVWCLHHSDSRVHPSQNNTWFGPWMLLGIMPKQLLDEWVPCVQFHCTSISHLVYLTNTTNMVAFNVQKFNWRRIIIRELPPSICNLTSYTPKLEVSP